MLSLKQIPLNSKTNSILESGLLAGGFESQKHANSVSLLNSDSAMNNHRDKVRSIGKDSMMSQELYCIGTVIALTTIAFLTSTNVRAVCSRCKSVFFFQRSSLFKILYDNTSARSLDKVVTSAGEVFIEWKSTRAKQVATHCDEIDLRILGRPEIPKTEDERVETFETNRARQARSDAFSSKQERNLTIVSQFLTQIQDFHNKVNSLSDARIFLRS